jgi:N-carbamoylputrescine amidase
MSMTDDVDDNVTRAESFVRTAASRGANVILVPELFEGHYFCKEMLPTNFSRAQEVSRHPTIGHFQDVARELNVVLPISVFERANNAYFNSVAIVDATGEVLGIYRKSHIPDGPGYTEKYYFSPGDTGFRVWSTRHGRVGVGICWDQWFPEAARVMALQGAEVLLYPTAIGSEPPDPTWDSSKHWQRTMQGHAAANLVPVVAANRHGKEVGATCDITFYGSSFIADNTGAMIAEAGRDVDDVLVASFDRELLAQQRASWGLFRDRRPELYDRITSLDGSEPRG